MKYVVYETVNPWPPSISRSGPWAAGPFTAPRRFRVLTILLAIVFTFFTTVAWLALPEPNPSVDTSSAQIAADRN